MITTSCAVHLKISQFLFLCSPWQHTTSCLIWTPPSFQKALSRQYTTRRRGRTVFTCWFCPENTTTFKNQTRYGKVFFHDFLFSPLLCHFWMEHFFSRQRKSKEHEKAKRVHSEKKVCPKFSCFDGYVQPGYLLKNNCFKIFFSANILSIELISDWTFLGKSEEVLLGKTSYLCIFGTYAMFVEQFKVVLQEMEN